MAPRTDFPPVRACLFDMDGLLLDTEDLYTKCLNAILAPHGKPNLPWDVKAKLQGRPALEGNTIFLDWAQIPLPYNEFVKEYANWQEQYFPSAKPLPGVPELLTSLDRTRWWQNNPKATDDEKKNRVHIALASSSNMKNFNIKTTWWKDLFTVFPLHRRLLGDDPRIPDGRGKPRGDIYLIALDTINQSLAPGEKPITPEECLVFEDSVPGVEAGRRAGMRVVWCPHPMLKKEFEGREKDILAGLTGAAGENVDTHELGEHDDNWAKYYPSLVNFPYEEYGMKIPPPEVAERFEMNN